MCCLHCQVIEATLEGFDVVYAPLISSYGSVTATLEACPGSSVSVFITYLTPPLQARMHETEGAYNLCKLDDIRLHEGSSLRCAVSSSKHSVGKTCPISGPIA